MDGNMITREFLQHGYIIAQTGYDLLLWTILARGILMSLIAVGFWLEPTRCPVKHTWLHRVLATVFALGAFSAFDRFWNRMLPIAKGTERLPGATILTSEMVFVGALLVLLGFIVYDWSKVRALEKRHALEYCDVHPDHYVKHEEREC